MNSSYELILKMRNHGLTTDYQCAKSLGCMPARISEMKKGIKALNPVEVIKLARIANMGPAETLEWIWKIETESPKERAAHAGQLAATVLLALAASFLMMMPSEGYASQRKATGGEGGIRTLGYVTASPDFESGTFDHSATSPVFGRLSLRKRSPRL